MQFRKPLPRSPNCRSFSPQGTSATGFPFSSIRCAAVIPNVPTGELVNYLVTAYCPVVNSLTGLSNNEKQARLSAFVSQVVQAAY